MSTLRLSREHSLNPSVEKCSLCGNDMGVVLFGAAYKGEAPRYVSTGHICDRCQSVMDSGGVFIFEACGGRVAQRTGRMIALSARARKELFGAEKSNVVHMEHEAFENLKKGDIN